MKKQQLAGVICAGLFSLGLVSNVARADTVGFADIVVEYFDSGNGSLSCPEGQGGVYPPPASSAACVPFSVVLGDDPGATSDYLSLPTGSFVTVGFVDDVIIDGPGADIFISEVGDAKENAEIYVSSLISADPSDFTFIGIANGSTITSFDLASIGFTGQVRSVKVLSLENGGFPSAPGFDLAHVEAINYSAVISCAILEGDLDDDCDVDGLDLAAFADGLFDENDLAEFASEFGRAD